MQVAKFMWDEMQKQFMNATRLPLGEIDLLSKDTEKMSFY